MQDTLKLREAIAKSVSAAGDYCTERHVQCTMEDGLLAITLSRRIRPSVFKALENGLHHIVNLQAKLFTYPDTANMKILIAAEPRIRWTDEDTDRLWAQIDANAHSSEAEKQERFNERFLKEATERMDMPRGLPVTEAKAGAISAENLLALLVHAAPELQKNVTASTQLAYGRK